jgi:hypothetical protein
MDDFLPETLKSSISEYSQRLINILTPEIFTGFQAILNESYQICLSNNEKNKYLMTFQNCIRRIPKYSQNIIETECNRIIEKSGCNYLEDLLTVTHVILLKNLTTIRVGNRQKKIDISIPKLDIFIHKVYINVGRKLYQNVDLFIIDVLPIQKIKNRRIIQNIIEKCILDTIRDSMPYENIIRSYLDETEEHEEEEFEQENDEIPPPPPIMAENTDTENKFNGPQIIDMNKDEPLITKVSFNPINDIQTNNNENTNASINELPIQRKLNEEPIQQNMGGGYDDDDNERIKVLDDNLDNNFNLDIFDLNKSNNKAFNANQPLLQKGNINENNFNLSEVSFDSFDAI